MVGRTTRKKILNKIAKQVKPPKQPRITVKHEEQRMSWAEKNMKMDFGTVIFTDECYAMFDGPDR